ncbi:uncharacterized protein LOC107841561 [Capsicum annuum]|uniref:uncharacterized protein LOC107841561 n=1 Tax=Capsicum annuum TaxID=4072 RepID=UPI0007BEF624|nr:uncharacterized protein LOC107841561 [Capsicum annuum]
MTVNEYCLRFDQLSKYAPKLIADTGSSMSKFITGISGLVVKECRTAVIIGDRDLSRLITHAQWIEVKKLKGRERGNKKVRIKQFEYGQARSLGGNRLSQNSVSCKPSYPSCSRYGKNHPGECLVGQKGYFGYNLLVHCIKECLYTKQENKDVRLQTQATSTPAL